MAKLNINNKVLNKYYLGFIEGKSDECWCWFLGQDGNGYGSIVINENGVKIHTKAHILSYLINNKLDDTNGLQVLHTCDNPSCVNPNHLFLGTNNDNMKDKTNKGRQAKGIEIGVSKLTEKEILEIREKYCNTFCRGPSQRELAREYDVDRKVIWSIIHHKTWKHI